MIGLDTNVLVRYLTQDDPAQSRRATRAIEESVEGGEELFIACVVMCELVWVLREAYDYRRGVVADVLEQVLRTAQLRFENKDQLWLALHDYRRGKGDFADYLVGRICAQFGCEKVLTFDRAIRDHPIFESL